MWQGILNIWVSEFVCVCVCVCVFCLLLQLFPPQMAPGALERGAVIKGINSSRVLEPHCWCSCCLVVHCLPITLTHTCATHSHTHTHVLHIHTHTYKNNPRLLNRSGSVPNPVQVRPRLGPCPAAVSVRTSRPSGLKSSPSACESQITSPCTASPPPHPAKKHPPLKRLP